MDGIVLSRRDIREYDQVISLYTEENGKVEFTARGVKKITSKNAAALEPCSFVRLGIAEGKEIDYLTTVNVLEYFPSLRCDLLKLGQAWFLVAAFDRLLARGVGDDRVFALLWQSLSLLNEKEAVAPVFLDIVFLKLFQFLGYTPQLEFCVKCQKPYTETDAFVFHPAGGGLLCGECQKIRQSPAQEYFPLTPEMLGQLRQFLDKPLSRDLGMKLTAQTEAGVHRLVYNFVAYYSEKSLVDWRKIGGIFS